MSKVVLNIVYGPHKGPDKLVFQNHLGEIWHSGKYNPAKQNIGMGWYSLRDPKPSDSLMVVEPYCVLPRDYNVDFASKFKYIFTWATKAFTDPKVKRKVVPINLASCGDIYYKKDQMDTGWLPWNERSNEIVIIANNKSSTHKSELYSFRIQLADFFHYKTNYKVSWYGTIPLKDKPYFKGPIPSKQKLLTKMRFSICTENSYDPIYTYNYFTEKMPEVWASGAVPLYIGCYNINDFKFPTNSYIDLRNYISKNGNKIQINEKNLLSAINNFNAEQYALYRNTILNEVLIPNKMFNIISSHKVYKKMVQTFAGKIG